METYSVESSLYQWWCKYPQTCNSDFENQSNELAKQALQQIINRRTSETEIASKIKDRDYPEEHGREEAKKICKAKRARTGMDLMIGVIVFVLLSSKEVK